MKTRRVSCRECGRRHNRTRLYAHLQRCTRSNAETQDCSAPKRRRIILYSKRGTRVLARRKCSNCGAIRNLVWRYSKSSRGTVLLCTPCKNRIYDRSHGRTDLWVLVVRKSKPGSGYSKKGVVR